MHATTTETPRHDDVRVYRYCTLEDLETELVPAGPGASIHLWCRRAWFRAVRISMAATRGSVSTKKSWWMTLELPSPFASKGEIESAYRRLAQKHHPDKGSADPKIMDALNAARAEATLSKSQQRRRRARHVE